MVQCREFRCGFKNTQGCTYWAKHKKQKNSSSSGAQTGVEFNASFPSGKKIKPWAYN